MIFVTVGMHHQGFDRLIKAMDEYADQTDEPVVMQIGSASYEPKHAQWFRFDTQEEVDKLCSTARVIVSHVGAGTIISAFRYQRPIVVVPRRSLYREVVDDHQYELAQALSEQKKVIVVDEPSVQGMIDGISIAPSLVTKRNSQSNLKNAIIEILQNS